MSKMTDLCVLGVFFQALKYTKTRFLFCRGPGPRYGSLRRSPDPLVGWGGGHPLPIPFPLDAFGISIRPRLVRNLYTWPSGQKRWTPLL